MNQTTLRRPVGEAREGLMNETILRRPAGESRNDLAPDRLLRRPTVQAVTGMARSTIYSAMANGTFPKPVRIGLRAVGWRQSDVSAWLASRETA